MSATASSVDVVAMSENWRTINAILLTIMGAELVGIALGLFLASLS